IHGDSVADVIGTRTMLIDESAGAGGTSRDAVSRRLREAGGEYDLDAAGARQQPLVAIRRDLEDAEIGIGEHELVDIDDAPHDWSTAGQRILRELAARTV